MPTTNTIRPIEDITEEANLPQSPSHKARIAVSTLNQWVLDFNGNRDRIIQSIQEARDQGATYRLGPELEVPGYSCEDHFYEEDTTTHSYEVLAQILDTEVSTGILSTIGMPVMHEGVRYNCDVHILNRQIIGIRPKHHLADDGNYREPRWFTAWQKLRQTEEFTLPPILQAVTGDKKVPIGDFLIETNDTILGSEKCEEMFTPRNPGIEMSLDGAELLGNGSGSHWQLRKLNKRLELIQNATSKTGGAYAYANLSGGDGGRLVFDGSSMIAQNGQVLAQAPQFSLKEVQTTTAVVDFEDVKSLRGSVRSLGEQAAQTPNYPRIKIDHNITSEKLSDQHIEPIEPKYLTPSEEIAKGPALWLWDYIRRSGASGFFLPLSGGIDSAATATIVFSMCNMVLEEIKDGNTQVLSELRRITKDPEFKPQKPQEIANKIFFTCYMANEGTSSKATEERAANLAKEIGAYHIKANIGAIVQAFLEQTKEVLNVQAKFESEGGNPQESIAIENLQARSRMVLAYQFAQLIPAMLGMKGFLLVLGSSNVNEALRGYFTKFDCSAADINPIGGIDKTDLRNFLQDAIEKFDLSTLLEIVSAAPTAELQPLQDGEIVQTDEDDMGMSYEELRSYAILRKEKRMGPLSMFKHLLAQWGPATKRDLTAKEVAKKVKYFFKMYAINRHKMNTLTPSVHAESYSPDDNRFDLRPFLLSPLWAYQFTRIDKLAKNAKIKS